MIRRSHIKREVIFIYRLTKKGVADSAWYSTILYDTAGRVTSRHYKLPPLKVSFIDTFLYDKNGRLAKEFVVHPETKQLLSVREYRYDTAKNEATRYDYTKDTTKLTIERRRFNDKKQLIETYLTLNTNPAYLSRKYFYNDNGDLIRTDAFDPTGKISYSYIYEYDKKQHSRTEYRENRNGKYKELELFLDDDKRIVKSIRFDSNENIRSIGSTSYNTNGTMSETVTNEDGKDVSIDKHYYDSY